MTSQIEEQIMSIDLSRLSHNDTAVLAHATIGTPAIEALKLKVFRVLENLKIRDIDDDFDVAMLGVKLNYALPRAGWDELLRSVNENFGESAVALLRLRIVPDQEYTDESTAASDVSTWSIREHLNELQERIDYEGRVAPHQDDVVATSINLRRRIGQGITDIGFISDIVSTLAEVGRTRRISTEAQKGEQAAQAEVTHVLSQLIIDVAPEKQEGWSFKARAYELEGAYIEAEFIRLHNVQCFEERRDWEGLLLLLGQLDGRARDARMAGLRALIRFPNNFIILRSTITAMLREDRFEEDFTFLSELSSRLLHATPDREREARIPASLYAATHMRALELGIDISKAVSAGATAFLEKYENPDNIRFYAQRFRSGAAFLNLLLASVSQSLPQGLNEQLTDILHYSLCFGSVEDQFSARQHGYASIEDNTDIVATRRWLAQLVVKCDGELGVAEAERLLKENIQKYEDEESRVLLRQIESGDLAIFLSGVNSPDRVADPRRLKGVGQEHGATIIVSPDQFSVTQHPLPKYVEEVGKLKQFDLYCDEPRLMLDAMRASLPTTAQGRVKLEMLEARFGDASDEDSFASFPGKFELALRLGDLQLLDRIQFAMPKLSGLTLVAKSLFGDLEATKSLLTFFANEEALLPSDQILMQRLKRKIASADAGTFLQPDEVNAALQQQKGDCLVYLMDANESHALKAA